MKNVLLILTIFCLRTTAFAGWSNIINCNNGNLVVDVQCAYMTTNCTYQMVIRDRAAYEYIIQQSPSTRMFFPPANGEWIVPVTPQEGWGFHNWGYFISTQEVAEWIDHATQMSIGLERLDTDKGPGIVVVPKSHGRYSMGGRWFFDSCKLIYQY